MPERGRLYLPPQPTQTNKCVLRAPDRRGPGFHGCDHLFGDALQIVDPRLDRRWKAVNGESDRVQTRLCFGPQQGLDTVGRRAVDRPGVQADRGIQLERDHPTFLHLPGSIPVEGFLQILARLTGGLFLTGPKHQSARSTYYAEKGFVLDCPLFAVHLGQVRNVTPGDLWTDEDSVTQSRSAARRWFALRAHFDGWMRFLVRGVTQSPALNLCIASVKGHFLARPQLLHQCERLL